MRAKDVMTHELVSIGPEATIDQAAQLMLQKKISGLLVVDRRGDLEGIVTEGDFLRRVESGTERRRPRWLQHFLGYGGLAEEYSRSHGRKVSEVMTRHPLLVTVTEDTPVATIVQFMEQRHIKRVPVVRGARPVGIVTRANLLHALVSIARDTAPAQSSDQDIRSRLLKEMGEQVWVNAPLINVTVRNGIIDLWGTVADKRQRDALVVMAENTPGSKDVRDHLIWFDPETGLLLDERSDAARQAVSS